MTEPVITGKPARATEDYWSVRQAALSSFDRLLQIIMRAWTPLYLCLCSWAAGLSVSCVPIHVWNRGGPVCLRVCVAQPTQGLRARVIGCWTSISRHASFNLLRGQLVRRYQIEPLEKHRLGHALKLHCEPPLGADPSCDRADSAIELRPSHQPRDNDSALH